MRGEAREEQGEQGRSKRTLYWSSELPIHLFRLVYASSTLSGRVSSLVDSKVARVSVQPTQSEGCATYVTCTAIWLAMPVSTECGSSPETRCSMDLTGDSLSSAV